MEWVVLGLAAALPVLLGAAFRLGRVLPRPSAQRSLLSPVTQQHLHLFQGGRLTMKYVDRNVTVPPNARIITSGLTQRVPKGLLVGVAVGARKNEQDDAQDIAVVPLANFDALESVTIILNPEQR